jgi:hypothetical protein
VCEREPHQTDHSPSTTLRHPRCPKSLYRHVPGKDDLVVLMADSAFGELGYPDELPSGWRARVELAGRTRWALHRRHPWLAHVNPLTRPLPLPNLATHSEVALAALQTLPVDLVTAYTLVILLYSYVTGMAVNLERETHEAARSGLTGDQWMDTQLSAFEAMAASGRYPTFARTFGHLVETGFDLDIDALFERGLRLTLDGVEVASTATR